MKPKFDAKAYRLEYHKAKRLRKIKIVNYNLYSGWKEDDGIHYSKFVCSKCRLTKESPFFYLSSLRFCKSALNFSILSCKICHNKRKKSDATILRNSKVKASTGTIPNSIKIWLQEEKLKKEIGTPPLIRATLNQPMLNAVATSSLDSSNSTNILPTLSEAAPPRALG